MKSGKEEYDFYTISRVLLKLPNVLRIERLRKGLSQDDVSEAIGLSRKTVSLCELGGNVSINVAMKYLLYLKGLDLVEN